MKKRKTSPHLLFFLLCFLSILIIELSGPKLLVDAKPEDQKIFDFAGLFTEEEILELEEITREQGEVGEIDIVIITENGIGNITRKKYLEDFYDTHGFGYQGEHHDAALMLVNMDPNDRGVEIQGYKKAEHYLHNDRTEHVLDDLVPLLSDGYYFEAAEEFAKQVAYYMNEEKGVNSNPVIGDENSGNYHGEASYDGPSNYYGEKDFFTHPIFHLIISLGVGALVVAIMAYHSSGKVTTHNRTYLDEKNSRVVARHDRYIRTTTTRVKKPSNNSSGGRSSGGGGISSGGHSHSGGGRSF